MAERVTLIGPAGQTGTVAKGDMGNLPTGWRAATPDELVQQARETKYGGFGGMAAAGGVGLVKGLIPVLGPAALRGIAEATGQGPEFTEAMQAYQQIHPGTAMTGEVVGSIIGVGKAMKAAKALKAGAELGLVTRAVTAPTRLAMGAGEAAAQTVGRIPGAGAGMMTAARLAAEGAMFGAGHAVDESALRDTEMAGELLSSTLGGTLVGGGLGVAMALGGRALRGVGRKVAGMAEPVEVNVAGLNETLHGVNIKGVAGDAMRLMGKAHEAAAGKAGAAELLTDAEARLRAVNYEKIIAAQKGTAFEAMDAFKGAIDKLSSRMRGELKRDQIARSVRTGNEATARRDSWALVDGILDDIDPRFLDPGAFGSGALLREAHALGKTARKAIQNARHNADVHMAVDVFKRDIGKINEGVATKKRQTSAVVNSYNKLHDVYTSLQTHLESRPLWGKAAEIQEAVNKDWHHFIAGKEQSGFSKFFVEGVPGLYKKRQYRIGMKKVHDAIDGISNPAESEAYLAANDWFSRGEQFAQAIELHAVLDASEAALLGEMRAAAAHARTAFGEAATTAARHTQLKGLTGGMGDLGSILLGSALGPSALALAPVLNPRRAVSVLSAIDSIVGKARAAASGKDLAGKARAVVKGSETGALRTMDTFRREAKRISDASNRRDEISAEMDATLADVAIHAPRTVEAAKAHAIGSVDYLAQQIPPGFEKGEASLDAAGRFLRISKAVQQPQSLMRMVGEGELTTDVVKAVKATSPAVFRQMQADAMLMLMLFEGKGKRLPLVQQLQLGLLLETPVHGSQEPSLVQKWHMAYNRPSEPARKMPYGTPKKNDGSTFGGDSLKTGAERTEEA